MDVGEFSGRRLYTGLRLDYRLRAWAPASASRAVAAVATEVHRKRASTSYFVACVVLWLSFTKTC